MYVGSVLIWMYIFHTYVASVLSGCCIYFTIASSISGVFVSV
jgi:hypothetical protein